MDSSFKADSVFEKNFTFQSKGFPTLDSIDGHYLSSPLWEFVEGSKLRIDLDKTRSRLDDKDLISWGKHTSRTDLSSFVMPEIRHLVPNISFELFTRAWLKLMEILMTFPVINFENETINDKGITGLFMCEAPGSFVHATNYYIKSERPNTRFNWLATSLNIYYEQVDMIKTTIGDDRFIQCRSTYDKWFFGDDDQGNLLNVNTIKQICDKFKESKADLITGDGGVSCIDEPDKQEQLSFPLIYHQFITAINCLKPGGSLILKMFNLFSSQSLSLIYLTNNLFNQVNCYKPVLSKSGNSEVYLVCVKLLDGKNNIIETITSQYFDKLMLNCDILSKTALLDRSFIPQSFVQQFINCSKQFKDYQKMTIISNLDLFNNPNREKIYSSLVEIKKTVARIYTLQRFPLKLTCDQLNYGHDYITRKFNCFKYYHYSLSNIISSNESYEKRKAQKGIISREKISNVLKNLYQREEVESLIRSWTTIRDSENLPRIKMNSGKAFTKITNSRFINKHLLHLYNLVTSIGEKRIHEINDEKSTTLSSERTKARVDFIIRSSFELVGTKYGYIIAPESTLIVGPILKVLNEMQINPKVLSKAENSNCDLLYNRNIIIIDPFDYTDLEVTGNCVSIIEQEQNLIENMVDQLIDYLRYAKPFDLLAIHSSSTLSRLMVELIFILTTLFKHISVVPNYTVNLVEKNNSIKHIELGLLIVFSNLGSRLTGFPDDRKEEIIAILKTIKYYSSTLNLDTKLLEIFPIIEVLDNSSFCELTYTGNFVQLTEKMESLI